MRVLFLFLLFIICSENSIAQYLFDGTIDKEVWKGDVFLSIVEDYRQIESINNEQIITKVSPDDSGYFKIEGNQLESDYRIYKLHVDNCESENSDVNHFQSQCSESREIVFIAKSTDTIRFPLSFNKQMFCDIRSNNPKTLHLFQIDSIKEQMMYAFSEFRSNANRKLNNKKWFKTLQEFGEELDEPLAELYIYYFLSDRASQFHSFYMNDLKENSYYNALLYRLEEKYANTKYAKQYKAELASDRFMVSENKQNSKSHWIYFLIFFLIVSLGFNVWLGLKSKRKNSVLDTNTRNQLTKQENNVLDFLLLDKTNKEIAEALFVSVSTVKSHVNNIYKKYNVNSRQELKAFFKV